VTDCLGWLIEVHPVTGIFDGDHIFALLVLWEHLLVNFKVVLSWLASNDVQSGALIPQRLVKVRYVLELVFESWQVDRKLDGVVGAIVFVLH